MSHKNFNFILRFYWKILIFRRIHIDNDQICKCNEALITIQLFPEELKLSSNKFFKTIYDMQYIL